MIKQYKSDALAAVHETALGLAEAGVVAKQTMKAFDEMCLTLVEELSPEQICEIRLRKRASQAVIMEFDWDEKKNKANLVKHGVSFETAKLVFDDPCALSIQDRHVVGEERWQTVGLVGGVVVILVAHTYQLQENIELIRIISARKATKKERNSYEPGY